MDFSHGRQEAKILNGVARSFALTLRLLPASVRPTITLAYLLARVSDTEADGANVAADFELLACKPALEAAFDRCPDRDLVFHVLEKIQEGQAFDAKRFPGPPFSKDERDRYTYLVAGCVGEFWTDVCQRHILKFSRLDTPELHVLGVRFGQALQLVNIIRDREKDASLGRVYLSAADVPAAIAEARTGLVDAERYVRSLRRGRLRMACALPLLIARATLDLLEENPAARKISRARLYALCIRAIIF